MYEKYTLAPVAFQMQFSFDFDESEDYIWQSFTRKLQLEMTILFCGKLSQVAKSGTGLLILFED